MCSQQLAFLFLVTVKEEKNVYIQNVIVLRFPTPKFSMHKSLVRIILITCVTSQRCKIKSRTTFTLSCDNNVLKQKTKQNTQSRTNFKIKYQCRRQKQNRSPNARITSYLQQNVKCTFTDGHPCIDQYFKSGNRKVLSYMISPNNWMCSSTDNNKKKMDGLTPGEKINSMVNIHKCIYINGHT